ncbi:7-carboxy-7-deazaguanine synthase [Candidatus Peregrinibacteria bacterium CG_4_10_14_0_2_um_filter_38_24]|nr:MAG: 7-carboxy-7-deazaguanine synthase [Candidatus Peregrinibacteria bacterium CG_4_10_14_0_2_um_filter_38_24]
MQVCEIFYSIQGEGQEIGQPAIFLRLQGCNLRCKFCDTAYSQEIKKKFEISTDKILKKIKKFPAKHIVITGGEPLLQQKELIPLLKNLKNYFIEIETNGTIKPIISQYVNKFNCSPKLSNAIKNNLTYDNLKSFPKEKTIYKFVVNTEKNIKEIKKFIKTHDLPKNKVFLMPQGKTTEEIIQRSKFLIEICKKELFRFAPRLHIMLWNNQKKI